MGLAYNIYLNSTKVYGCKKCKTHLSIHDDIVSRVSLIRHSLSLSFSLSSPSPFSLLPPFYLSLHMSPIRHSTTRAHPANKLAQNFRGQHGKAYLFETVVNVHEGEAGERNMTTGRHIVRDIRCKQCAEVVGWKYDKAFEATEKYKEGKFILEAELLCTVN